jgi:hypothetical protein
MGMPQLQFPIFPEATTLITPEIAFECRQGKVTYVHGHLAVFHHAQEDVAAFRYFTSQLVVHGTVGQPDIARAFHVSKVTLKRYVKRFREGSGRRKRKHFWMRVRVCRRWPRRWSIAEQPTTKPVVARGSAECNCPV